ncbi:PREDICTED: probable 18S rRNA (guanine-N(7))-methyltransferase [Acropora digitifera]|uniref:probable 18S rRNA (guanine-N(7))-methyltransferase n=1 Tax=Acropora digitifera TaxID=70779 RepID=UPI00077A6D66|nr:PREDICTED: probable 18S rRNA (guanine-N(7))-methyltransferase [Acropora digitifera]
MASGRRPEHQAPPEVFYNEDEARKYTSNLAVDDVHHCCSVFFSCGSGLSGEVLTDEGHHWVGLDISQAMLDVAIEREVEGDLFHHDAGQGLYFKPGTFDGCVSISALQWLCNADKKGHNPVKRLYKFFSSLYSCLSRGSRAVFQFYPENPQQVTLHSCKTFHGFFLSSCQGLGTEDTNSEQSTVQYSGQRQRTKVKRGKSIKNTKNWIKEKKERRRRQGKEVRPDSKYTGRKRRVTF